MNRELKQIVEALLFSCNEPLSIQRLKELIDPELAIKSLLLKKAIEILNQEYEKEERAFRIEEIAEGYILRTIPAVRPFVEKLHRDGRGEKLSTAATEVLAIVAHHETITRREIEELRGVDSSGVVASLLERGLIEPKGRKEVIGRPIQYGISKKFLLHFGLRDFRDLQNLVAS